MPQVFEFRLNILGLQKSWTYTLPVRPEPVLIGRQSGIDLLLDHPQVSRRHAALYCTATQCVLVDLGSANGTRLNGENLVPQVPAVLKPGDSIQIGAFNLDFEQLLVEPSAEPILQPGLPLPPQAPPGPEPPENPPSPPEPPVAAIPPPFDPSQPPPGLTFRSDRLLGYLPAIYHTDFTARLLAIFESVLLPIEWQIDSFDLFLHPGAAPAGFLPWLANWFQLSFDAPWSEAQKRSFLKEAHSIYSSFGTRGALSRVLEIYTGCTPEIDDQAQDLPPHTFRVSLPAITSPQRAQIERLIDAFKPAHTAYVLEMDAS